MITFQHQNVNVSQMVVVTNPEHALINFINTMTVNSIASEHPGF